MKQDFIPGAELCRRFFVEGVGPVLAKQFPRLRYTAALLGEGSDVLGFDTAMSMDHGWGPRMQLFLEDLPLSAEIDRALQEGLPDSVAGIPTRFSVQPDGNLVPDAAGKVRHAVTVTVMREFFVSYTGYDLTQELSAREWLTIPEQQLRSLTSAHIFHDDLGLTGVIDRLTYYPRDVWLYQMASVWERIGQEEHLVGRAGYLGDELGARLIAARIVRDLMRLCFLIERVYAPYPKWFGTAFRQLRCASELEPLFMRVLDSRNWQERDAALTSAYEAVARMHNELALTDKLLDRVQQFFGRPFNVIHLAGNFSPALRALIEEPSLKDGRPIGGIDVFSDSTDLSCDVGRRATLREMYEVPEPQ